MKNILIIKQGALGDIIMATGLIKQIMEFHRGDNIWLLTTPQYHQLFQYWDSINLQSFPRKGLKATWQTICWIRNGHFSRLYDLQSNDRTRLLCILSGVDEKVGNHPCYPYTFHPQDEYTGQCHIHDRMLEVLASAGVTPRRYLPFLITSVAEKQKVDQWITSKNPQGRELVILHAGSSASHPDKRWPYYAELASRLDASNYLVVWTGADEDKELNRSLSRITGVDATSEFSVLELVELGKRARFALTSDSGPMHVLSCAGIPVYAFFGPTNWRRNHAIGQESRVISPEQVLSLPFPAETDLEKIGLDYVVTLLIKDGLLTA